MWSLKTLKRITIFDESDLPPELRAQRILNRSRVPEMSHYVVDNPDDYIFSALTASIDSDVEFEPLPDQSRLGTLTVPIDAKFIINDGQHRRAAIMTALEEKPELGIETIAVVFFLDIGLERSQQMFADLNRYAIRPSRSLSILYDQRSEKARLAKLVVLKSEVFREIVDLERSSLAPRSRKLFTLSAFFNACSDLVRDLASGELEDDAKLARDFWEAVADEMNDWLKVRDALISSGELRENYIHAHGIVLQALGRTGNALLKKHPEAWKKKLRALRKIDWSKRNAKIWEGRALIGGKVSKSTTNVTLTVNVIKTAIGLDLLPEELKVEKAYAKKES